MIIKPSMRKINSGVTGAILVAVALAATLAAAGAAEPEPQKTPPAAFVPPKYQFLPDRENWSVLRNVPEADRTDFFDPIKYLPLSEDGQIWASFGGSARLRLENWWNFNFLPGQRGDDTFLLWRGRMHADVHLGEHFRVFAEGKTALATDRDLPGGTTNFYVDSVDLQQLFFDVRVPIGEDGTAFTARAGRQMYQYGRQRLVSPLPWGNTLRSWDGLTGVVEVNGWRIDAFGSLFDPVRKYEFNEPNEDVIFYGGYAAGKTPWCDASMDLYFLGLSVEDTKTFNGSVGTEDRYTFGARLYGIVPETSFDYDVEAAYQFGRVGNADVSAWMLGAQYGYTFADVWSKPRLLAGLELGSGDNNPGGNVQTFNQLFPLGHAYMGYIDLVGRQNAISPEIGVEFSPIDKLMVAITGYYFWRYSTDDALYNAGGAVIRAGGLSDASSVGQEIDITGTYKFNRHASLMLGYSHFFAGEFIEESGTDNDVDFLYFEFTYTF